MPVINCVCGHRLDATDNNALFAAYRAHSDEAHADLGIADDSIRKLVAASTRMTQWDGTTKPVDGAIEIRALKPELSGDFLRFFDRDAFMDNPDWSGCYCLFYQYTGDDWDAATPEQNRGSKAALIHGGQAHGYLAYLDGAPVAWCHAAPRATLPGLDRVPEFRCDDDPSRVGGPSSASTSPRHIAVRASPANSSTQLVKASARAASPSPRPTRRSVPCPTPATTTGGSRCISKPDSPYIARASTSPSSASRSRHRGRAGTTSARPSSFLPMRALQPLAGC